MPAPTTAIAPVKVEGPPESRPAFRKSRAGERILPAHPNKLVLRTLNVVGFNKLFAIEADGAAA